MSPAVVGEACWPAGWRDAERAELASLAGLPAMTASLLRRLVAEASPRQCWLAIRDGHLDPIAATSLEGARLRKVRALAGRWAERARSLEPAAALDAWRGRGLDVLVAGDAGFPAGLAMHPSGPWVLFVRGKPGDPERPRVAVVGTRSSTAYGEAVAARLAEGLAACGAEVVTSLEAGIDAAARTGALRARDPGEGNGPLVVAVGGADLEHRRGSDERDLVASGGRIVSEAPFGASPERWRFPRRNRLVALASDVVVVVEAHATGGVLHGAEAAIGLGIPVCAVPGSVRSPSSRGTNGLLADGAHVVRDVDDVLAVVELTCAGRLRRRPSERPSVPTPLPKPDDADGEVLACVEEVVTPLELVLRRSGRDLRSAALSLDRLASLGLVARVAGGYERPVGGAGNADRLQP